MCDRPPQRTRYTRVQYPVLSLKVPCTETHAGAVNHRQPAAALEKKSRCCAPIFLRLKIKVNANAVGPVPHLGKVVNVRVRLLLLHDVAGEDLYPSQPFLSHERLHQVRHRLVVGRGAHRLLQFVGVYS